MKSDPVPPGANLFCSDSMGERGLTEDTSSSAGTPLPYVLVLSAYFSCQLVLQTRLSENGTNYCHSDAVFQLTFFSSTRR